MTADFTDIDYMREALEIARRGLGRVAPNPSVGCIIVKDGNIVARARTADGGRPHAESLALKQAGENACGACAYVSLEPCAHHGKTPPCCQALVSAGIKSVVIACADPDMRVAGKGVSYLRDEGVEVVQNVLEKEALALNCGFFSCVDKGRPFVSLKMAVSIDGKIASAPGVRTQISGKIAHKYMHLERSRYDAILVGVGTVLADDPLLSARVDGVDHIMTRIVLDTHLRISLGSQLIATCQQHPLWVFCDFNIVADERRELFENAGVLLFDYSRGDLHVMLETVSKHGVTRLMVEGGAQVNASFLSANLADELMVFKGVKALGESGLDAISGHDLNDLTGEFGLKLKETIGLDQDSLDIYVRKD